MVFSDSYSLHSDFKISALKFIVYSTTAFYYLHFTRNQLCCTMCLHSYIYTIMEKTAWKDSKVIHFLNWVFSHRLGPFTPHRWAEDWLTESCDWTCNIDAKTWKTRLSCCESVIFLISIISSVEINFDSQNLTTYISRKDKFNPYSAFTG